MLSPFQPSSSSSPFPFSPVVVHSPIPSPVPPALIHPRSRAHELEQSTLAPLSNSTFPTLPVPPKAMQSGASPLSLHSPRFIPSADSQLLDRPRNFIKRIGTLGNTEKVPPGTPPPNIPIPVSPATPSHSSPVAAIALISNDRAVALEDLSGNETNSLGVLHPPRKNHRRHRSNLPNSPSIDITSQFAAERTISLDSFHFLSSVVEGRRNIVGGEMMEVKLKRILTSDQTVPLDVVPSGFDEGLRPEKSKDNDLIGSTLDEPFLTPPTHAQRRRFSTEYESKTSHMSPNSLKDSPKIPRNHVGLGILPLGESGDMIGLGIVEELRHPVYPDRVEGAMELEIGERALVAPGGGFGHSHVYNAGLDLLPIQEEYQDPPSPPPLQPHTSTRSTKLLKGKPARLPSSKGIQMPGVITRTYSKRVYPRIRSENSPKQAKARRIVQAGPRCVQIPHLSMLHYSSHVSTSTSPPQSFEMVFDRGTPDLSGLPGAFIASPVLPTSFTDFSHSPLPTPPTRFARLRKNVASQSTSATDFSSASTSSVAECTSSSSPTFSMSTSSALLSPLLSTSPVGTPTLAASSAFSSSFSDAQRSASSTPMPETHTSNFTSSSGTSYGSMYTTSETGIFDIAITSTIVGAIVCLGAVTWLAFSMLRGRGAKNQECREKSVKRSHYDHDDKPSPRLAQISYPQPQPPPLARLSFQRKPEPFRGDDVFGGGWISESAVRGAGSSTEDHGGYPEMIMRGDGASLLQRRASGASIASKTSQITTSTRPTRQASSSRRTSGESSIADSTFFRSSVAASSRTSHGISPTPPRIPSPVGIRYSGEGFFTTPPETPTKGRWVSTEDEPPVPIVPLDFREFTFAPPSSPPTSRSRLSTHSTKVSKSPRSTKTVVGSSNASLKARKLQKRRATVDGATLRDDQDKVSVANDLVSNVKVDAAAPSTDAPPTQTMPRKSSLKKPRPVTMPPAIVVSDHPQDLIPPSSPVKAISSSEVDSSPDSRLSIKTFQTMPWIRQSPSSSSGWTTNFPRDDCSILDPDMRSSRNASIDTSRFSVQTLVRKGTHIAAVPGKGEEDHGSVTDHSEGDPEDDQDLRSLRRKTLLYSVYKQRGVHIPPPPSSSDTSPVKSLSGTDSESTVNSIISKVTKRQSIVLSFPAPPEAAEPTNESPIPSSEHTDDEVTPKQPSTARFSGASFELEYDIERFGLDRTGSSPSLLTLTRSKVLDTVTACPSETDIASLLCTIDGADDGADEFTPCAPLSPTLMSPGPPPRPAKSTSRKRREVLDDALPSCSTAPATATSSSRIPMPSRTHLTRLATTVSPFADLATQSASLVPRSFAADLQAAVGTPATGYDSDTLLSSNLSFRKPYSLLSSSLYSTQSSSVESLEEAAIARAESVHFSGRGRASGIPRRSIMPGADGRRSFGYESDESTYDDSETESLDLSNRHLGTAMGRDGY